MSACKMIQNCGDQPVWINLLDRRQDKRSFYLARASSVILLEGKKTASDPENKRKMG